MSDDINLEKNSARSVTDVAGIYKDGTYLKNNATWHVGDSPWKARHIATILKKNGLNPSSVCEVGCGAGEILKQLSNASPNINFVGYELSPQAFELCKNRESEKVSYRLKNIFDENVFYDCLLCIDVFEHEPKLAHGLIDLPNIVITPHIASASDETRNKMSEIAAQNVIDFLAGEVPDNVVAV